MYTTNSELLEYITGVYIMVNTYAVVNNYIHQQLINTYHWL